MSAKYWALRLCDACIDGVGAMCHDPECALCRHKVDLPICRELLIDPEEWRERGRVETRAAVLAEVLMAIRNLAFQAERFEAETGDLEFGIRARQLRDIESWFDPGGGFAITGGPFGEKEVK